MSIALNQFVKEKRKLLGLTQEELSFKSGVGLRFIRELERGKPTLQMDKVNQVLKLFGYELGAVELDRKK
jgi:y4mF family transcriptional regulator